MNIKSKFIGSLKDMKIRKKLIVSYVIVVLIPILIVGIYLTMDMRKMVVDKTMGEANVNNDRIQDRLTEIIKIATDVSDRLYFDENLKSMVLREYKSVEETVNVYRQNPIFDEYMRYYKEIEGIRFYVDNETMLDDSQFIKTTEDIRKKDWYKKALERNGGIIWAYRYDEIVRQNYLSLIRLIRYDSKNNLGVLVINISKDRLSSIINDEPFHTVISINEGTVIIDNKDSSMIGNEISLLPAGKLKSDMKNYKIDKTYNDEKCSIIINSFSVEKAAKNHFQIYAIVPIADITRKASEISLRGFSIIGLSFVLALGLIVIFANTISKRIILLRKEMHKVVSGDFNIRKGTEGKDEIGELYDDLYKMIESIKQLIDEVYIQKIQKEQLKSKQKEVEFKMLASQINPHFLYNTLETIRMKAFCSGEKEIAHIVKMLGKIMRRNLEAGHKSVSLQSEVDLVKSYLEIQKLRFGEKVDYSINILTDISSYEVLPLLFQPIIENAFVHGLESKEGNWYIEVTIKEKDEFLIVEVSDNGLGIEKDKLDYLNKKINDFGDDVKKSIGLSNVNQRIKLCYGENYGINIESNLNEGTKVSIFLPRNK